MKKFKTQTAAIILAFGFFLISGNCFSQGAAVNTTGASADASAILDVSSATQGMLIPRVALDATTNQTSPISNPANSLIVYNTATNNDVTPGFYFWDAATSKWTELGSGTGGGASEADLRAIKTKIYTNLGGH